MFDSTCTHIETCREVEKWLLKSVETLCRGRAQDLTRDVLRIDAIPSTSLDGVREWLTSMDIKFYENKVSGPPCSSMAHVGSCAHENAAWKPRNPAKFSRLRHPKPCLSRVCSNPKWLQPRQAALGKRDLFAAAEPEPCSVLAQINLNWKPILKNILEDPEGFIADGGWDFLDAEGGSASEGDGEGAPINPGP